MKNCSAGFNVEPVGATSDNSSFTVIGGVPLHVFIFNDQIGDTAFWVSASSTQFKDVWDGQTLEVTFTGSNAVEPVHKGEEVANHVSITAEADAFLCDADGDCVDPFYTVSVGSWNGIPKVSEAELDAYIPGNSSRYCDVV